MTSPAVLAPLPALEEQDEITLVYPLHGAFAVPDKKRGYKVVDVQQGMVTALRDDSVTVTSADGFTRTYPLPELTRTTIEATHGVTLTHGCRITLVSGVDEGLRVLSVDEPRADGTLRSDFVPLPRA